MSSKTCFVVMPIKKEGTPDYAHFRALYEDIVVPTLEEVGFEATRADDIQRSGAITRDIVVRLAEADLVVADLTDLNPNVFYEVGVRHSLRGRGTIMLVDENKTAEVPFDLGAYRVIKFKGEVAGLSRVRRELSAYAASLVDDDRDQQSDNPVHDWLPSLPVDAVATARGSEEGRLRAELAKANQRLQEYERIYGPTESPAAAEGESPLSVVMTALADANDGKLPSDLLRRAEDGASTGNKAEFLAAVRELLERPLTLSPRDFLSLITQASVLGLPQVSDALFSHARQMHPGDTRLRNAQLATWSHSTDPQVRVRVRAELHQILGISVTNGEVDVPDTLNGEELLVAFLLDAYQRDELHDEALAITSSIVEQHPADPVILRNHARSLDNCGKAEDAYEYYLKAIWAVPPDETAAVWLGNFALKAGEDVNGLEAFALACRIDPDDGETFSLFADTLADIMKDQLIRGGDGARRPLPDSFGVDTIRTALVAAFSCETFNEKVFERCVGAARTADLSLETIAELRAMRIAGGASGDRMTLALRVEFASGIYDELKSTYTQPDV